MAKKQRSLLTVFAKFPCKPIDLKIKSGKEIVYLPFEKRDKIYIINTGELLITDLKFKKGDIVEYEKIQNLSRKIVLKDITYIRTSNDYKHEPFIHHFNGTEKFINVCIEGNNECYLIKGIKRLWKQEER